MIVVIISLRSLQRYRLFTNNCEHLAMLATIGRKLSIQVSKEMYEDLSQKVALPLVVHGSDVLTRNTSKGVLKATGKFVGSAAARAAARAAVKGSITGGAAESAETTVAGALSNAFKVGYPAAVTGASIGIVSGVAVAANAGIEGPMLVRGIYKLHRQKKFKKISKQAYKHGVTRASITRVSTFIGGSGGALIGQVVIPVPVLGAVVGGIAGTVTGKVAGHIGGKAIANAAFKDKIVDLPVIVVCDYDNLSELDV